ncbi:MAG TPA: DedA family protein [Victivallales bacterium]|nr:DedA family protein [Victivallales bacterium]
MSETDLIIKHIDWAISYAHVWGFLIIFILMALESSLVPFPSEVIMIPAGFLAYRAGLSFASPGLDLVVAIIIGTVGSLAGAYFNYYLALLLGRPILYKYGKYFFLKPQTLERAEEIFREYGEVTTFVCRLLPAIRQLISIPAGLSKMRHSTFILFTVLGAGIWVTVLSLIGYYLGSISKNMSYGDIVYKGKDMIMGNFIWILLGLVIIVVIYGICHHKIMNKSKKLNS